ncbi:MAG: hypothetical protein NTY47_07575, partial [Candidatus Omnitrophica bacterium]|nr:hypothetical protein [Candidatus Omnitrophota bacterium]
DLALGLEGKDREFKLIIKNINGVYSYERYTIDSSCSLNCDFSPAEKKDVDIEKEYGQNLVLKPYSLNLIILKPRPKEPEKTVVAAAPTAQNAGIVNSSNSVTDK